MCKDALRKIELSEVVEKVDTASKGGAKPKIRLGSVKSTVSDKGTSSEDTGNASNHHFFVIVDKEIHGRKC